MLTTILLNTSCFSWKEVEDAIIRTDIVVHVTVNNSSNSNPIPDQIVIWSIHLYNGTTNFDSNIKTGEIITNNSGEADIPIYECQLSSGLIARIIAYTPDQDNSTIEPVTVTFNQAVNAANEDYFAEIFIDYVISK